jgi:hypothetical protein
MARSTSASGRRVPLSPGVWRVGHGDEVLGGLILSDSRTSPRLARSGLEHPVNPAGHMTDAQVLDFNALSSTLAFT